jgi:serine/threonine-protein kinase
VAASTTVCPQCALEYVGGEVFCPNDGARLSPKGGEGRQGSARSAGDPLLGQTVGGRYRILRKIGEGGMGIVYEAEHVIIEKRVGLKVLRDDFSSRPDVVERFRQEAKSASRIGHEHIIDISDFGETPSGASFFVMELLQGHDLAEELSQKGALAPRRTIDLALQCARALGAAHAKGIVHRDMKPENIFLVSRETGEDFIKIVDFGIAKMSDIETGGQPGRKLTKTGMIFGTPEYMSPEQASGKKLDHRVDIYALGIIMYELLAGRVPFVGDTFMGILTQHMFEQPEPLRVLNPSCNVPPELERIVYKALAKQADDRYQSMEELASDLSAAALGTGSGSFSSAPPPGTVTHHGYAPASGRSQPAPRVIAAASASESPAPRNTSGRAALVGGALGLLVAAGGALFLLKRETPAAAPRADAAAKSVTIATPAAPSAPGSVPAPQPSVPDPAPAPVTVSVSTVPPGASLSVDGQLKCAATPCEFSAPKDSEVRVTADKPGYRQSSTEVTLSSGHTRLELVLRRRPVSQPAVHSDDELKLPDLSDAYAPPRRRRP